MDKVYKMNQEYGKVSVLSKRDKEAFNAVKKERDDLFMECFHHISENIDGMYTSLTRRNSDLVVLTVIDEPFGGSVDYCYIIPEKPCQPMGSLSGGEQSLASSPSVYKLQSSAVLRAG